MKFLKKKKRLKKVRKFFATCKIKRIEYLEEEFENCEEFLSLSQRETEILHRMKEVLPPEDLALLNEYSDTLNNMMSLKQYFFYQHGFNDSITMHHLFNHKNNVKLHVQFV
ncbi:MAG: hypothetical protein N2645_13235 [Clostridia bacterium]|nr:hypothetical protein [Clostridia bacterium]